MFQLSEQTANSSVSINVWDRYAKLNSSKDQPILDADNVHFTDNIELACTRPADPLLSSVMTGLETVNCGKYTHGMAWLWPGRNRMGGENLE